MISRSLVCTMACCGAPAWLQQVKLHPVLRQGDRQHDGRFHGRCSSEQNAPTSMSKGLLWQAHLHSLLGTGANRLLS